MSAYHTEQKKMLEDFLSRNRDKGFTIDEITEGISSEMSCGVAPARSTVYSLVGRLVAEGRVRKFVKPESRKASYQLVTCEHCDAHLHLKCVECGRLFHMDEAVSDELLDRIRSCSNFSVDEEETVLYGKCAGCNIK